MSPARKCDNEAATARGRELARCGRQKPKCRAAREECDGNKRAGDKNTGRKLQVRLTATPRSRRRADDDREREERLDERRRTH